MTKEEFADAYAQTITYGMLSARWLSRDSGHRFTRANLPELLPPTSPFLRDLFQDLLSVNLEFNDNLLHCAYALDNGQIVLSGAQQIEDLDYGEFQAMIEDMVMAIDSHLDQLTKWRPATIQEGT